jgi:hypothetical protein
MKKNILIIFLLMMAWGLFYSKPAHSQYETKIVKGYKIISKSYFSTPWLSKVFPGVKFYRGMEDFNLAQQIFFDIDSNEYNVMGSGNILIKKCESIKHATIEEIIEAIVRLQYYDIDTTDYKITVTKEFNKNPLQKSDTTFYNYKVIFKNLIFPEEQKLYFLFDGKKFIKSCGFEINNFHFKDASFLEKKDDEVFVNMDNLEEGEVNGVGYNYLHYYYF